jgi:hypothetical protein
MRQTAVFASVFLAGASAFAADPQLMNLVMPGAQVMAGVNVTAAEISPLGQYVLTRIGINIGSDDEGLQSFISTTGFDPRRDVTEILLASAGTSAGPSGLMLAKGTFNVDMITAAVAKNQNHQISTYNGATLITSTGTKASHAIAFIGNSIAAAGDAASVKAALDRVNSANSVSPQLAALVQTLSTNQDAWSVSIASIGSLIPDMGPHTANPTATQVLQLVKNIQSSSGGVKFGENVVVTGQAVADTPQNATAVADLIRMVSALVSAGAAQNPEAGAVAQLLQTLQVSTSDTTVNVTANIPEAQIEALLKSASPRNPAARPRTRRL